MGARTRNFAFATLIFFALLSNLQLFRQARDLDPKPLGRDEITLYEKRFEGLKNILLPHSVVGYISSKRVEDIRFDVTAAEYYLTQYALAPVMVVYSQEPPLVVGNFHSAAAGVKVIAETNLILLKDFGNGVMLLSHETK